METDSKLVKYTVFVLASCRLLDYEYLFVSLLVS